MAPMDDVDQEPPPMLGEDFEPDPLPLPEEDLEHFVRHGYLVLPSVVEPELNAEVSRKANEICAGGPYAAAELGDRVLAAVPELHGVLETAGVRGALEAVVGKDYLLHGHRHLHVSSGREQMWHKDSYWGYRRQRHHRPRWCMMLYYPQETTMDMGPTHVLAGSQYWTLNSEKSPAGEDILQPRCGRLSMFLEGGPEERSEQLREAEAGLLEDPRHARLVTSVALTVPAGSCVLMQYDLFHRAGCRLSELAPQRFMLKFQFVRTVEPPPPPPPPGGPPGGAAAAAAPHAAPELAPVFDDVRSWLRGESWEQDVEMAEAEDGAEEAASSAEAAAAEEALRSMASGEVERVGAAYLLGRSRAWRRLLPCLLDEREALARAASYGLAASGPRATAALVGALEHSAPRVRMLAAFALGESARPSAELLDIFSKALAKESPAACAVLLQALGCIACRARSLGVEALCQRCVEISLPFAWWPQHILIGEHACLVVLQAAGPEGVMGGLAVSVMRHVAEQRGNGYMGHFASEALRRHASGAGACLHSPPATACLPEVTEEKHKEALLPPLPPPPVAPPVASVVPRKLAVECATALLAAALPVAGPREGVVATGA